MSFESLAQEADMIGIARDDAPVAIEGDGVELRMREVGGDMTAAFVRLPKGADLRPALAGVPDDRCQTCGKVHESAAVEQVQATSGDLVPVEVAPHLDARMAVEPVDVDLAVAVADVDEDRTVGHLLELLRAAAAGYALGLVPSADVAARLASGGQVDLREQGSGNPGGANAAAVLGARWGYAVMAADIAKGAAAARVERRLAGDAGQHLAAFASVVGHCYPVTKGFRGGKGVGCSVGQCLATFPAYLPADLTVAAAVAAGPWKQRAFAATTVCSVAWVAGARLWWRRGWPNAWGGTPTLGLPLAAAASSAVIFRRFRAGQRSADEGPGKRRRCQLASASSPWSVSWRSNQAWIAATSCGSIVVYVSSAPAGRSE